MARGGKRGHKGGSKRFTNPQALEAAREKEEKGNDASDESGSSDDGGVAFAKEKVPTKKKSAGAGAKAESSSESSEEESSSEDERKTKGVEGLIEIENPNLRPQRQKKVSELSNASSPKAQLTRREREEVEKQKAKAHYQKLHAAGKTEEARADLARLAIIRKQREEAAKKREEEQKAKEQASKTKKETTDKALGKKK